MKAHVNKRCIYSGRHLRSCPRGFVFCEGPFNPRDASLLWSILKASPQILCMRSWFTEKVKRITSCCFLWVFSSPPPPLQTSKTRFWCLTGLVNWKSRMPSVVMWSGLWDRIPPTKKSCMFLETQSLTVGCMHHQHMRSDLLVADSLTGWC